MRAPSQPESEDLLEIGLRLAFGAVEVPPDPSPVSDFTILRARAGITSDVLLREPPEGNSPAGATDIGPGSVGPQEVGSYRILGEIARGGLGVVLRARDRELGRETAMKMLLEDRRGEPQLVRRFIEEAQIAAQLQHPGIVPIYEFGLYQDRTPYFTMKLIQGRTLQALLAERRE